MNNKMKKSIWESDLHFNNIFLDNFYHAWIHLRINLNNCNEDYN
jgi:hypothetical protein